MWMLLSNLILFLVSAKGHLVDIARCPGVCDTQAGPAAVSATELTWGRAFPDLAPPTTRPVLLDTSLASWTSPAGRLPPSSWLQETLSGSQASLLLCQEPLVLTSRGSATAGPHLHVTR